ncbi:MAG TPA: VWA domain-containing protein [Pyrinomonadaceae bacterium]|nr:VWA domain-containing protein [Pyrinomonadaceae bacterium]
MPTPRFVFLAVVLTVSFCLSAFAQDDENAVVTVDSSIVVLNATITDGAGRHVPGLAKSQFTVLEDGVEQEISTFTAEDTPFAAVILLDTSGSMEQRVALARSAAIRFLDGLRETDAAQIYNFDTKVTLVQKFSNSRDISEKIFDLKAYGFTALNDSIYRAATDLSNRPEKRRAIIVLSDGADNRSEHSADRALKAALAANAVIYTVDMSSIDTGQKERLQSQGALRNFAEKTGGSFIKTPGGAALRTAFEQIVGELGKQYTIAYEPKKVMKDGKWRAIELRVAKSNLTIRTRKGYHAQK